MNENGKAPIKRRPVSKLETAKFFIECIQLVAVLCAVFTLYFYLYPQNKPNNSNLLEKANAGDNQAQIELAHFYYETGDFSEAVYWYKVVLMNSSDVENETLALNNLGYLYSRGYGLSSEAVSEKERLKIALSLFNKAIDLEASDESKSTVAMNKYLLLITFGEGMFDNYDTDMKSTYEFLRQTKNFGELTIIPERRIVSQDTFTSSSILPTGWVGENTYIVLSGAAANQFDDGYIGIQYTYVQTVYEEGQEPLPELRYMIPSLQEKQ